MKKARPIGTGSHLPSTIVDNKELSRKIPEKSEKYEKGFDIESWKEKLSGEDVDVGKMDREEIVDNWVRRLAGIEKRHIYVDEFDSVENFKGSTEHMGAEAAKKALEMAGVSPGELDLIVAATFTPNYQIANAAATIGHLIGTDGGHESLTINTACTGFIQGLGVADRAIRSGDCKYVLVVAAETLSKVTNYKDAKTAVLFADGAGAAVLRADDKGILGYFADTKYSPTHIVLEKHPGYVVMGAGPKESSRVLREAVRAMEKAGNEALKKANLCLDDVDYIIPHQANQRITNSLVEKLRFSEKRVIATIREFGNTSAASVGIALDKAVRGKVENCRIEKGNKLLLTSVGGGYTLAGLVAEY